ncbi:hypothetical protein AAG906_030567 [Vitis piasezkii]
MNEDRRIGFKVHFKDNEQELQATTYQRIVRHGKGEWKGKNGYHKIEEKVVDFQGKRVSIDKSKVECYNCHRYDHYRFVGT